LGNIFNNAKQLDGQNGRIHPSRPDQKQRYENILITPAPLVTANQQIRVGVVHFHFTIVRYRPAFIFPKGKNVKS